MKGGAWSILAAAFVAVFCTGTMLPAAAAIEPRQPPVVAEKQGEWRTAQVFRRDRDLRGRQRHIQQFREVPRPRDADRYLRERRERSNDSYRSYRDRDRDRRTRPRRSEQDRALDALRRGDVLPLGGIIHRVQRYCPGTFLDATLHERGNQFAYRVSILRPSGRRVTLLVDAQSGVILGGRCN